MQCCSRMCERKQFLVHRVCVFMLVPRTWRILRGHADSRPHTHAQCGVGMQAAVTSPAPAFVLGGSIITMGAAGSNVTSQVRARSQHCEAIMLACVHCLVFRSSK